MLLPWYRLKSGADGLLLKFEFRKEWKLNYPCSHLNKFQKDKHSFKRRTAFHLGPESPLKHLKWELFYFYGMHWSGGNFTNSNLKGLADDKRCVLTVIWDLQIFDVMPVLNLGCRVFSSTIDTIKKWKRPWERGWVFIKGYNVDP